MGAAPNPAVFWKKVGPRHGPQVPFFLWWKGIPTAEEIKAAPLFTVFASPKEVRGRLPESESAVLADDTQEHGTLWFIDDTHDLDPHTDAYLVTQAGLAAPGWGAFASPWMDMWLSGKPVRRKRGVHVFHDHLDIAPLVIDAGYSLIKLPYTPQQNDWDLYVLDTYFVEGRATPAYENRPDDVPSLQAWFEQTPLRRFILHAVAEKVVGDPSFGDAERDEAVSVMERITRDWERLGVTPETIKADLLR